MTELGEWFVGLVPTHGLWVLGVVTYLSCLALPVAASLVMLTAGAFAASGDLVMWQAVAAALVGAIAGDQTGYWIARVFGPALIERLGRHPKRRKAFDKVGALIKTRGAAAVFLTRWLFSPLGPWLNLAAGATGYSVPRFAISAALGEMVWVALYLGTGYGFASNLAAASELIGSVIGVLGGVGAMLALGWWLWGALRAAPRG